MIIFPFIQTRQRDKITISGKLNAGTVIKLTDITGKEIKKIITNTSSSFIELIASIVRSRNLFFAC